MFDRRVIAVALLGVLGCESRDAAPPPAPSPRPSPAAHTARWDGRLSAPEGFALMDRAGTDTLRAGALRGTATNVDLDAWVSAGGPGEGLLVSMDVTHAVQDPVYGHTLGSWVAHQLRGIEAGLASLDAKTSPLETEEGTSIRIEYSVPLPSGSALRVRSRAWLNADGHLVEAQCQCSGTGCTEPPSCRLPDAPADALAPDTVLGGDAAPQTLSTASGDGSVQTPPHLAALPADVLAGLARDGADDAPERSDHRVHGVRDEDGSGAFLTEATWCADTPPCSASKLAENRRKAEVATLRESGALRSVKTLADMHAATPTFGYEIEQRDGFWTRTMLWNRGGEVREVTCACAGLACGLVRRTCSVNPM